MTKREAFEHLTSQRGWYKELDIPEKTANSAKVSFRKGQLSSDKIDEILLKAGYRIIQVELWEQRELTK